MTQILVIGCGGFIGSHLVESLLLDSNNRVTGWDVDSSKIKNALNNGRMCFRLGDINDAKNRTKVEEDIEKSDIVINLAAICNPSHYNKRPLDVIRSNFSDAYWLVDLVSAYRKWLIHFSTSEVYGRTLSSFIDPAYSDATFYEQIEDATPFILGAVSNQRWTYACAKQLLERYVYAHHMENGLDFSIVRPYNFFGPRMDYLPDAKTDYAPRVLACFIGAIFNNEPLKLVDGGIARRTILGIRDAIAAVVAIINRKELAKNKIFNIGSRDNEVHIYQLAEKICRAFYVATGDSKYLDYPITKVTSQAFYGIGYEDCDRRMPNVDKAKSLLGWNAKQSLDEVLLETVRYYLETEYPRYSARLQTV